MNSSPNWSVTRNLKRPSSLCFSIICMAFECSDWSFPVLCANCIMHSVNELWLCIWDWDYHSTYYYCWAWGADMYQRTNLCLFSGHQRAVHRFRCTLLYISPPFLLLLHLSIHSFPHFSSPPYISSDPLWKKKKRNNSHDLISGYGIPSVILAVLLCISMILWERN